MDNIFISVNIKEFITKLKLIELDENQKRSIRFSLTSISENVKYSDDEIEIPLNIFLSNLINLGILSKRENLNLVFDELTQVFIRRYLDDIRKSKESIFEEKYRIEEIVVILKENGFNRELTNEQKRDLLILTSMKHGANFSVPGAGKTTTLLALFIFLRSQKIVDKLLVISPMNAFISWEDEIRDIFPEKGLRIKRISSQDVRHRQKSLFENEDILLINYEKLRSGISGLIPFINKNKIHLVLDESHRIKSGFKNLSFIQIDKIADSAIRRDILSGTPLPQSINDLVPQFSFLWRRNIFPFLQQIEDEDQKIEVVNKTIINKFVRTTKNELDLPEIKINYQYVEMGPIQKELYKLIKSESSRILKGLSEDNKIFFRQIGSCVVNLIQAATNPMLLGTNTDYYENLLDIEPRSELWSVLLDYSKYEKPAKVEYLKNTVKNILRENSSTKVLIWTYFIRNIKLLEKIFEEENSVSIYGAIPTGNEEDDNFREARIRRFHSDESCRVMIANPQACGEGISLHKACHHAIYLDRNFNAAYYLQSIDRIHRLGLDGEVRTDIDLLIARGTIDELIAERLNKKAEVMGKVLNDSYLLKFAYDPEDIPESEFLGLDKEDVSEIINHIKEP